MENELRRLANVLAERFATEGRPGGDLAAQCLREAETAPISGSEEPGVARVLPQITSIATTGPDAAALTPLIHALPWRMSGQVDGRIKREVSDHMATAQILGPEGPMIDDRCRVGLFFQSPGLNYPMRRHAAEETFLMLAGAGEWRLEDQTPRRAYPGDAIHHPAWAPHASVTSDTAFLAAWRWTGEIGFEHYKLIG